MEFAHSCAHKHLKTYPTLILSFPPSHLIRFGAGWLKEGSANRDAIKEQCAAYLRLEEGIQNNNE